MSIVTGILVYVIAWWLAFFIVLPIGATSQQEAGQDMTPGTAESAPAQPRLGLKALAATLIAGLVLLSVYLIDSYDLVRFRQ